MTSIQTPWRAVPRGQVLRKNPKPLFRDHGANGFWVLPYNHRYGMSLAHDFSYGFLWSLGFFLSVIPPLGLVLMMIGSNRNERETLKQIGYQKTGPDTVQYGRYERHNGKLYFCEPYTGW